jgi:glycosyltransferase involved in cell wall biosynthesis
MSGTELDLPSGKTEMRILYLATRVCWPVRSGAHLRDFHIASYLARNSKLTYIGLDPAEDTPGRPAVCIEPIAALGDAEVIRIRRETIYKVGAMVRGFIGPVPINVLNYTSQLVAEQVEKVLSSNSFDVVQIEGILMQGYLHLVRQLAPNALVNADWHNIDSEVMTRYAQQGPNLPRRLYAWRTLTLLRNHENELLRRCDTHTVCSEREQQALLARGLNRNIEVIPNGVDWSALASLPDDKSTRRNLIFVGAMDYHANIDAVLYFVQEIWPSIRERRPELNFVIVGSKPAPEIVKLGEQPGVSVTGTVPDVRPHYQTALAAMIPIRIAGGTRLKILEAMAAGVPVVSTSMGAEGIPVTDGKDILLADSVAGFVECAAKLAQSAELWQGIAAEGRKLARAYDWALIGDKLMSFYQSKLVGAYGAS